MLDKLEEMQKNIKLKLDDITVDAEAGEGKIKVQANANRKILNIVVDPELLKGDADELEDLLLVAINRVLDQAEAKAAVETQSIMSSLLPPGMNIPGMFG